MAGEPAYVFYISPTQINVQAPEVGTGTVPVTVTNANGTSNAMSATADSFAPAFFTAGKYAIATHVDGTLVAPAKRGETLILWGTGFGPVSPAVPPGQTSSAVNGGAVSYVTSAPAITIGGVAATVVTAGLNPSALGLCQIAVTVPSSAAGGDPPIVATAGGKSSPASGVHFTVE